MEKLIIIGPEGVDLYNHFVKCRLAREKAYAEHVLAVNYLAALLSRRQKKKIRSMCEGVPMIYHHFGIGLWVRNQLRRAGFNYYGSILDDLWIGRLTEALSLPKNEIALPDYLWRKVYELRLRNLAVFLTRPLVIWTMIIAIYSTSLIASFLNVHDNLAAGVIFFMLTVVIPGIAAQFGIDKLLYQWRYRKSK